MMEKLLASCIHNPEPAFFIAGVLASFLTYVLHARGKTRKNLSYRLSEGLTCALLTSGVIPAARYYFNLPPELSILCGVFIGILGIDTIHLAVISIVDYKRRQLEEKLDLMQRAKDDETQ